MIQLKRAYEPAATSDGYRVLVDRLWPRGLKKDTAHLDAWLKELAPSDELRKWFGHDPDRFTKFEERYERELRAPEARSLLDALAERATHETVTLVYAAHDEEHNNAVVLAHEIERSAGARPVAKRPAKHAPSRATGHTTKRGAPPRAPKRAAPKRTAKTTPKRTPPARAS